MTLPAGARIGSYEIVAPLGAGGMGEVYRARDTRLDRDVAIKLLPEAFARDAERLARFEREAKTLASLNHPNIAQIYGFEVAQDFGPAISALVMELVEGEDLSDRIARGPMSVPDALAVARQIADALEAAHERGIVHRDLKPANIKLGDDGRVKVLDFGLAKAFDPAGTSSIELMNSPTITSPATQLGMIIGTAAYMSPEQAKGKAVDRRADVWAFGVVLFEMLTGKRVFAGDEVTDVLASVLKDAPAHDSLPPATPHAIRRLLRRCLEKDRAKRLDSMAAARLEIDEALGAPDTIEDRERVSGMPLGRAAAAIALTAVVTALIGGAAVWRVMRPAPPVVMRFGITPPAGHVLRTETNHHDVAISRDGKRIVYWSQEASGANRFFVRSVDSFDTRVLEPGPEARGMSFAPSGDWIVFQAGGRVGAQSLLAKVPVTGGAPTIISPIDGLLRRASWGDDDTILYATASTVTGLFRVAASGGTPEAITTPDRAQGEVDHLWPEWLPGSTHALFTIRRANGWDVGLADVRARTWRVLARNGTMPSYVPTGHVVYVNDSMLQAVPFDLQRMDTTGEPVRVGDGVVMKETSGAADYAVSATGTLVYLPGSAVSPASSLVWIDRQGKREPLPAEARQYVSIAIAPDGLKAAATIEDDAAAGLWVLDLQRFTLVRLTPPGMDVGGFPIWSPDSRVVAFGAGTTASAGGIHRVPASGAGAPELILRDDGTARLNPTGWTPDGRAILFVSAAQASADIAMIDLATKEVTTLINSPAIETAARVSPDGRWLAYTSNETGRAEVFIRPFPNVNDDKIPVTAMGARAPSWRADGRELLVRSENGPWSVSLSYESGRIRLGRPARIVDIPALQRSISLSAAPDASRFLIPVRREQAEQHTEYRVVINWFEELKAKFTQR